MKAQTFKRLDLTTDVMRAAQEVAATIDHKDLCTGVLCDRGGDQGCQSWSLSAQFQLDRAVGALVFSFTDK